MVFNSGNILLVGSILLFISMIVGRTGYRLGMPSLLLFLLVGMIFGSDGVGIQFHNAHEAQFIGVVSLCIILFAGGMDTKMKDIRPIISPGIVLSTVGVLATTFLTGLFVYWISGLLFPAVVTTLVGSLLLAAVMSSTDSASVFNILRSKDLNLRQNLRPMLELESGSNDPMAYMLTILLIQIIVSGEMSWLKIIFSLATQFSVGAILGYLLGRLAVYSINHLPLLNDSLYQVIVLTFVFFTFSFTELLHGNGYLAVYIAGLVVGNRRILFKKNISNFFDGLAWLFQIIMFLALGLLVNPKDLLHVTLIGSLIGLFLIFVARPLSVYFCLLPFRKITPKGRMFISWVGLRGAVPIIFATYPLLAGIPGAEQIFNIVFFITILSLILQGTTIAVVAKFLGLASPAKKKLKEFGMEFSDEIKSIVSEAVVTSSNFVEGSCLTELGLPDNTLVVMIKRYDRYFVPDGRTRLLDGDKLLILSDNEEQLIKVYTHLGIEDYTVFRN